MSLLDSSPTSNGVGSSSSFISSVFDEILFSSLKYYNDSSQLFSSLALISFSKTTIFSTVLNRCSF